MITYITAFIFYTLAMIGVLIGGFVIYKKVIAPIKNDTKGLIQILDTYVISPKKSLVIAKVSNEKFLLALDCERTTFLTKLEDDKPKFAKTLKQESIKENYDLTNEIEKEIQEVLKEQVNLQNNAKKARNEEIQRQFMDLYQKDEVTAHNIQPDEISRRRQMIRNLISELNDSETRKSKING